MPTLNTIGQRRERAAADIHQIAAQLAERYNVPDPVAAVELGGMSAVSPTPASIANYNAQQTELIASLMALFASVIEKITPLG